MFLKIGFLASEYLKIIGEIFSDERGLAFEVQPENWVS